MYKSERPGVYLLPPKRQASRDVFVSMPEVSVTLNLGPGCRLDSIYPWTEIKGFGNSVRSFEIARVQTASWKVSIDSYGNTFSKSGPDKYFGHLSWETFVHIDRFLPAMAKLTPQNSVVLLRHCILDPTSPQDDYLQQVLTDQLGLPEDIVHDFQNYFVEKLREETQGTSGSIVISFVNQGQIQKAASLIIRPEPHVTARILMLFGVPRKKKTLGAWAAKALSAEDALRKKNWANIIGLQPELLTDTSKYRAIEWGIIRVPNWKLKLS